MLPYIIRAADLALRLVPGNLREAAAALGAPGGGGSGRWSCPPPVLVWPRR
jgi:ABC-type sulfate transport system permease component